MGISSSLNTLMIMMIMMKAFLHLFDKLFNSFFLTRCFVDILSLHFFIIILYCCLLFPYSQWNRGQICINLILFSTFRKRYGLLVSELPWARCQPLKIYNFGIFLLTQKFFYISTLNNLWTIFSKPINHTIFLKNSIRSFRCT